LQRTFQLQPDNGEKLIEFGRQGAFDCDGSAVVRVDKDQSAAMEKGALQSGWGWPSVASSAEQGMADVGELV
jgi:hypothetical protein